VSNVAGRDGSAVEGSVESNIHYYNMDFNRDYGIVRAGGKGRGKSRGVNELKSRPPFARVRARKASRNLPRLRLRQSGAGCGTPDRNK
jgi:hypothetical protein